MPELPEVETTRQGLLPAVKGRRIAGVVVRNRQLRWPIPASFARQLTGRRVRDIQRRGKYLLWDCESGFVLSHLGMSGSLTALSDAGPPAKHDHVDIELDSGVIVRYTDPRRFGALLWIAGDRPSHPLLDTLGPEPFAAEFTGTYLHQRARRKSVAVKSYLMDASVVVGVGNIYASEALFHAGVHPARHAGKVSAGRYERIADAIRKTLRKAIRAGGSSLRNYVSADGSPGYFQLETMVYDRAGDPCRVCGTVVRSLRQGQRSTYYCPKCQT